MRSTVRSCVYNRTDRLRNVSLYEVQKSPALQHRKPELKEVYCVYSLPSRQHSFSLIPFRLPMSEMIGRHANSECFALPEALLTYQAGFLTYRSILDFSFSLYGVSNGSSEVSFPVYSGRTAQASHLIPSQIFIEYSEYLHFVRQILFTH